MIPVGSKYTVSLADADEIIRQLRPKIAVIPMHYRTDTVKSLPNSVEDYVREKGNVERFSGNTFMINLNGRNESMKYIILNIE